MSFAGFGRSKIRFDMFDLARTAEEARRAHKLANLYHRGLGIDPRVIMTLGRRKQMLAFQLLWEQMGIHQMPRSREVVLRGVNALGEVMFPREPRPVGWRERLARARDGWALDLEAELPQASLEPADAPRVAVNWLSRGGGGGTPRPRP